MHINQPIPATDPQWTLLLDRDGVINRQKEGSYIFHPEEFIFLPGVLPALKNLAEWFGHLFIITNQRGVGKGLMTEADLHAVHAAMMQGINSAGGRIDAIYYCPDTDLGSACRKPNTGMAQRLLADFPETDFSRSIMVGNSMSDMHFGRNIGAYTIFITSTHPDVHRHDPAIDAVFDSLESAAAALAHHARTPKPQS